MESLGEVMGPWDSGSARGGGVEGQSPSSAASPAAPPPLWLLSRWAVCPLPPMSGLLCSFCPLDLSGSPATSCQRLLCRAAPQLYTYISPCILGGFAHAASGQELCTVAPPHSSAPSALQGKEAWELCDLG